MDKQNTYGKDSIFHATEADKQEILDLYRTMLYGAAGWNENYPSMETIEFDLSRDSLFVLRDEDGQIAAAITIDDDEKVKTLPNWSADLEPSAELSRVAVREDLRGRGIARLLMEYAFDELRQRGFRGVHILVREEHEIALRAYEKLEYRSAGSCELFDAHFRCFERVL